MTWQLAHRSPDQLTVRFIPWLTWSFAAVVMYGVGTIAQPFLTGVQSMTTGEVVAIALLAGLMLFTLITGGQLGVCRIDHRSGKITVTSYGLLGRARQERPLADVKGLEVRVLRRAQYRLLVALRSGERLPLAPFYLVSFNDRGIRRIAEALGVEPEMIQEQRTFR
ncbi:hypothetical protein [uncultured Chloroflexus sp.]|uniref:hypothetical protein n=1 Tax=uncultured Chloroflexus sp. TaxID=214040 RepID=UPI002621F916|nr:hypothetical protein [uncultured Chloroflexus sp.]